MRSRGGNAEKTLKFLEDLKSSPAAYHTALRQLRAADVTQLRRLRVAVAANFRAEPLGTYLVVEAARRGFLLDVWFAPYGQSELECSNAESALFAGKPDIVVIAGSDVGQVERMV